MSDLPMEARYSSATQLGWTAFWAAWAIAGLLLLGAGFAVAETDRAGLVVAGAVLAAVALALLAAFRRRLTDPRPVIVVTADGFHDRRLGAPIPWSEVRSLRRHKPGNRLFLLLDVDRPARFAAPERGVTGLLARRLNPAMGFPVLVSRLDGLDHPQASIATAAEAALAATRSGPPPA